ncbi:TetR/AcrR family transcriptional regulator [Gordonia sp. TBRC 11910]|uniref:TetR/AcrR family transcriptional regulator n=1 Tax=Gordonia asplenii TaxID=2725283 RepID=A0A848L5W9_9ACTN|nr:TetR/AcrR family transcriptional regulator [Gordonia asplenii]NMO03008.1 TetR/AcrR family transcriptional regulator [Gordonia asplenii]
MTADKPKRSRDPEGTKRDILAVATREFAEKGLDGARIDEIAEKTATTKRMIYYYFGDKDALYRTVLTNAYQEIRIEESRIDVEHLPPAEALRAIAEVTFDHHERHPDFIRLVSVENMQRGKNIAGIDGLADSQQPALDALAGILARGRSTGEFRDDVTPLDLHILISSYCVFRVANRDTFRALFQTDLLGDDQRDHLRRMLGDAVVAYVRQPYVF